MVLQNESIDEELEHFEDVIEETDNEPITLGNKQDDTGPIQNGDNGDSDSSSEDDLPVPSEEEDDDDSDGSLEDGDFLLAKNESSLSKAKSASDHKLKSVSDNKVLQSQESAKKSFLPGGYDPRHREPAYCNGDRASWWELMVLSLHTHPSVATMARTLLSGANIVYHGNPLNDLSLTAFLDKFMEKKPKESTWHGGSQIEPAKQMDINNHLIGKDILSLAAEDVLPEDLVFHKFYTNKMSSTKPKKKKKSTNDEDSEFFDIDDDEVDGGDESDNEEIEDLLDFADQSVEPDNNDYDYDGLDNVATEEDEDLIGDVSDGDISSMSGDDVTNNDDAIDDDRSDLEIGDVDDASDDDNAAEVNKRKQKQKTGSKSSASPFASYEEFEHLMEDDDDMANQKKQKSKKRKDHDKGEKNHTPKKPKSKKKK